jgi:hypothetical protein
MTCFGVKKGCFGLIFDTFIDMIRVFFIFLWFWDRFWTPFLGFFGVFWEVLILSIKTGLLLAYFEVLLRFSSKKDHFLMFFYEKYVFFGVIKMTENHMPQR